MKCNDMLDANEMDQHWARLYGVIGREDLARDPRYADGAGRVAGLREAGAILRPSW